MLEFIEVALDQVALAVDATIDAALDEAIPLRGDMGLGAGCSDEIEQRARIVATVGDDVAAFETGEQRWCSDSVVRLTGGQHEPHGQAVLIDNSVDFGAQSATRATDGVILAPFFPPAACWWARMMEESISAMECGDFAARASKTFTQTPARAQRLKRL